MGLKSSPSKKNRPLVFVALQLWVLGFLLVLIPMALGGPNSDPFVIDDQGKVICGNAPGLAKDVWNLGQIIQTSLMGRDSRCPLSYPEADEEPNKVDSQYYGVGMISYRGSDCHVGTRKDGRYVEGEGCMGTGHLVLDQDMVISVGHIFWDDKTNSLTKDYVKKFKFFVKVWVPPSQRKDPNKPYEGRAYDIEAIEFLDIAGDLDEVAFIKLKKPVSKEVDGIPIDPEHQIQPMAFEKLDRSQLPKTGMTVAFQGDKVRGRAFKNCEPFELVSAPREFEPNSNVLMTNADIMPGASGSALALLKNGKPHYAAVVVGHRGEEGAGHAGEYVPRGPRPRYNRAIDANSFYDDFMDFRRKYGRN